MEIEHSFYRKTETLQHFSKQLFLHSSKKFSKAGSRDGAETKILPYIFFFPSYVWYVKNSKFLRTVATQKAIKASSSSLKWMNYAPKSKMSEYNVFVYYYFSLQKQLDKRIIVDEVQNRMTTNTYSNGFSISSFPPL